MKKIIPHRSILKIIAMTGALPVTLFVLLLLMPYPSYKNGFTTLDDIDAYAKTIPENFTMDTDNTIKPDFSSYYNTLKPTWKSNLKKKIVWLLTFVKLARPPLWSASFFKQQLVTLTTQREAREFKDNFVCKLLPSTQSKIIIFGNVQGAFHSLNRCLHKLKELGVLDNNLKLSSSDNFIIFTGDIIDRSPYTMETLSLVMQLVSVNPDNVLYLRGNHESGNYWQEHTLKTELQIRAAHLSAGIIPLSDEVNKFFNTLPLACYISMLSDNETEFIRISDSGRGQNEFLNEHAYAKFLTSKIQQRLSCFNLKSKTEDANEQIPIDIKVIFKGEKKRESYQPHEGLRLLAPDMESTAWTILSCPTPVYQKAIKFIHDAFVLLTPAKNLDEWKITLYNRNVQTQEPFKATTFYLLSGVEEGANNHEKNNDKSTEKPKSQSVSTAEEPALAPVSTTTTTTKPNLTPKQKSTTPLSEPSIPAPSQAPTPTPASVKTPTEPINPSVAPEALETFDAPTTTTITEHAESISKHMQGMAQDIEAIVTKLKTSITKESETQTKLSTAISTKNLIENKSKASIESQQKKVEPEEISAFEPITPEENDVKTNLEKAGEQ